MLYGGDESGAIKYQIRVAVCSTAENMIGHRAMVYQKALMRASRTASAKIALAIVHNAATGWLYEA